MLLSLLLVALLSPPPLQANADAELLLRRYREAVVRVTIRSADGGGGSLGTGFFVSPDGELVTNHHVFKAAQLIRNPVVELETGAGKVFRRYEVGKCDGENGIDVCWLRIPDHEPRRWFRPGWELPGEGDRVYLIGNPLGRPFRVAAGSFLGTKLYDNAAEVHVSIPFQKGMSGGPIFTSDGQLVGMTTRWITEWHGYAPTQRYANLETSLGISTRELQKFRKKVRAFVPPRVYFKRGG